MDLELILLVADHLLFYRLPAISPKVLLHQDYAVMLVSMWWHLGESHRTAERC